MAAPRKARQSKAETAEKTRTKTSRFQKCVFYDLVMVLHLFLEPQADDFIENSKLGCHGPTGSHLGVLRPHLGSPGAYFGTPGDLFRAPGLHFEGPGVLWQQPENI